MVGGLPGVNSSIVRRRVSEHRSGGHVWSERVGLYDVLGNVSEWTEDCARRYVYPSSDPNAGASAGSESHGPSID